MQRITTSTRAVDLFGPGKDGFKDGNLGLGISATQLNAALFNSIQEEICNVIEAAGISLDVDTRTQLVKAIQSNSLCIANAGGSGNAITAEFSPAIATLRHGLTVYVRAVSANSATTPTFSPDGRPAKTIVKGANQALSAGDIAGSGYWIVLVYDATYDKWVLINPAKGLANAGGYLLVMDVKPVNTDGGSAVVGINTRTLNTERVNTIPGAVLASNQITLPAGTYRLRVKTTSFAVNEVQAYFFNVTANQIQSLGMSCNGAWTTDSDPVQVNPTIVDQFTLSATAVFELRMYCSQNQPSSGLGKAVGFNNEIYSIVEVTAI